MFDPDLFAITHEQLGREKVTKLLGILGLAVCLASSWALWLLLARVTVYATTDQARVEVAQAVYPVEAAASGRVAKSYLALSRQVKRGDLLVELEAEPERLRLSQEQSHQLTLEAQLRELRTQLAADSDALAQERTGGEAGVTQARTRLSQAQQASELAIEELQRSQALFKLGLNAESDVHRALFNVKQKAAEVEAAQSAVRQAASQSLSASGEHRARLESIRSEIARLEGEIVASKTAQEQLQNEAAAYRIEAPGSGRLGSIVSAKSGTYIHQGDRLATIIPGGQLRIVAEFDPHEAIGRVKVGQQGRMRLSGFPWTQYGSIPATVIGVGSELRDGRVRVELEPGPVEKVRLQHGLPGTLEVAIDRVSPLKLLLEKSGGYSPQPPSQVASR